MTLEDLAWPASRLGEALGALAQRGSVGAPPAEVVTDAGRLGRWIGAAAEGLGIEAEPVEVFYPEAGRLLRDAAPALLRLPGEPRFLVLLGRSFGGRLRVLGPDRRRHRVRREAVRAALCRELEAPLLAGVQALLEEADIAPRRRPAVGARLLAERLRQTRLRACWMVRRAPGAPVSRHAADAGLGRQVAAFAAAHLAHYALWLASWWVLGAGVLQGRLDAGWLSAWALLLLTLVPLRLAADRRQGSISLQLGALLKRRLLQGALTLDAEAVRRDGAGQLLGRVFESQAVETLALSGGFAVLMALAETAAAAVLLAFGPGGPVHALLLVLWIAACLAIAGRLFLRRGHWTEARRHLTRDLLEKMVGHRTRLAQSPPARWHEGEDEALEDYLGRARRMDATGALLGSVLPRGWLLLGLAGLGAPFVSGTASAPALAVGVGAVLLAFQSLRGLAAGLPQLAGAWLAWKEVEPLLGGTAPPPAAPEFAAGGPPARAAGEVFLKAAGLSFSHPRRREPVLQDCTLGLRSGERLLLEGPSGGGKSTLASLLAGLRIPDGGLLLVDGLDRPTLGLAGWRRRVVLAPQFHENHVFTETFAFNLLLGRGWPPTAADLAEAEALCHTLGLGELLERMPAGLLQMVGETGWQLSHGEKSRLYLARALLQGAELVILDESFAALDPENLGRALGCARELAPTLMVIAHP